MWKHHGASVQAKEIQLAAIEQQCDWLQNRYPAGIDSEWLHPKALEVYDEASDVFEATACFTEAGDWLVWQLTAEPHNNVAETLVRWVGLRLRCSKLEGHVTALVFSSYFIDCACHACATTLGNSHKELLLRRVQGVHRAVRHVEPVGKIL